MWRPRTMVLSFNEVLVSLEPAYSWRATASVPSELLRLLPELIRVDVSPLELKTFLLRLHSSSSSKLCLVSATVRHKIAKLAEYLPEVHPPAAPHSIFVLSELSREEN